MNLHYVIIVPGLGDHSTLLSWATKRWARYGLQVIVYPMKWHDGEGIRPKLDRVLQIMDELACNGDKVSLIGCSAGGSAVLNVFCERKDIIHKTIIVCGRLKTGDPKGLGSLDRRSKSSLAFAQSVKLAENYERLLTTSDKNKIMTVRAMYDELVPSNTSVVLGAYNITLPVPEHSIAIYSALTVFSRRVIEFLS